MSAILSFEVTVEQVNRWLEESNLVTRVDAVGELQYHTGLYFAFVRVMDQPESTTKVFREIYFPGAPKEFNNIVQFYRWGDNSVDCVTYFV